MQTMLTIAGSDPSGGAGIQADIKTATALGVYAMSVLTALTAQNTLGVSGFMAVPVEMVKNQLDAVLEDIPPRAVKTGMLATPRIVRSVADAVRRYGLSPLIVDPVAVATSGDSLAAEGLTEALLSELIPQATLVTPNLPEAAALSGLQLPESDLEMSDFMHCAAISIIRKTGCNAVLIKGGHLWGNELVDFLLTRDGDGQLLRHDRIETRNTHGTGCTLSAAIASYMAKGKTLAEAVASGVDWLQMALRHAAPLKIGHGHGPVGFEIST